MNFWLTTVSISKERDGKVLGLRNQCTKSVSFGMHRLQGWTPEPMITLLVKCDVPSNQNSYPRHEE